MQENDIVHIHNKAQESPDFWLNSENMYDDWMEIKSFTESPDFNIAAHLFARKIKLRQRTFGKESLSLPTLKGCCGKPRLRLHPLNLMRIMPTQGKDSPSQGAPPQMPAGRRPLRQTLSRHRNLSPDVRVRELRPKGMPPFPL